MAITIIQEGKLPEVVYHGKCTYCGCEITCNYEDHKADWRPSPHKNGVIQVKCPTDGCDLNIRCKRKKN